MAAADMTVTSAPDGVVLVRIAGEVRRVPGMSAPAEVEHAVAMGKRIVFDTSELKHWDSSLLVLLQRLLVIGHDAELDVTGLPKGVQRLLALAQDTPAQHPPADAELPWMARLGAHGIGIYDQVVGTFTFVGEIAFSLMRLAVGKARMRRVDLLTEIESAGVRSLPIIGVVSFLLGMILAFVGGVTLRPFGATIFVANVVTMAMLRELGAVMTAIVMAGRTGSAYAAQLGTMKVTQEIDALTTMALPPTDFLVLPRVLALSLMMPLLCVYADFVAVVGGGVVAVLTGTGATEYMNQVQIAASLTTFWIGVAKSVVFGIIVAVCGCIQGLRADGGAESVGTAATSAVVTSIVWIIAVDGLFAVVLQVLKL